MTSLRPNKRPPAPAGFTKPPARSSTHVGIYIRRPAQQIQTLEDHERNRQLREFEKGIRDLAKEMGGTNLPVQVAGFESCYGYELCAFSFPNETDAENFVNVLPVTCPPEISPLEM